MEILKDLNEEQKKAVIHGEGPLLIVAGAGTGKTTVITKRLAYLVEKGLARTDEILALTFTDKAAGEMEERIDRLLPYGYLDLWISTFHSFCQRILKDYGMEIGLASDFKLLDETGQWLLVRKNLEKFNLDYYQPLGKPTKFIRAFVKHFSRLKDEAISPEAYIAYAEKLSLNTDSADFIKRLEVSALEEKEIIGQEISRMREIADAYQTYQKLLQDEGLLDFGDLINYTLQLFEKRPKILAELRSKFTYILVDEFQDTNWAQFELIKKLAEPKNNITVVGDDDQSIYKFRGASVSNILDFKETYPASKEIFLVQNYRSTQNILDLAYRFIQQNNPDRLEYKLKSKKLSKELKAARKGSGTIEHIPAYDADDEARLVVKKIIELLHSKKAESLNDFAILVRANDTASFFMSALADAEIDYQFVASRGLFTKPVIMDIIAYFKLLDDYHDSTALFRVLNWPYVKFSPEEIVKLTHLAHRKSWSLYQTLSKYHGHITLDRQAQNKLFRLKALIEKHSELAKTRTPHALFIQVLVDFGIQKYLNEKSNYENYQKLWQLNQFFKEMVAFSGNEGNARLKGFMEYLNFLLESGEVGMLPSTGEEGPEAVSIMTIHSAKGLEFPYVFIPQLVDKRFPTVERKEQIEIPDALVREKLPEGDAHLEEERRLFYVACTRAQRGLFFTTAKNYGGTTVKKPSRFLKEIGIVVDKPETKKIPTIENFGVLTVHIGKKKEDVPWHPPLPKHFSFSQFRAFETCPWQYRYAHLLKIPAKGRAVFSFGQSMHQTLYQFYALALLRRDGRQTLFATQGKKKTQALKKLVSFKELKNIYEEVWQDDWFDSEREQKEYKNDGLEQLKTLYEKEGEHTHLPMALEENFLLRLDKWFIKGRIDRIDMEKNSVEIIDYKTGRVKAREKFSDDDRLQLLIYQLALMQDKRFSGKAFTLSYYYLTNGSKASFTADEKLLEKARIKLTDLCEKIHSSDFKATPAKFTCASCDFKDICPFRAA